jgi:hypothetical protein
MMKALDVKAKISALVDDGNVDAAYELATIHNLTAWLDERIDGFFKKPKPQLKAEIKSVTAFVKRDLSGYLAKQKVREEEEIAKAKEWAEKAKLDRQAVEEAQAKAARQQNQDSTASLPEPAKPRPLVKADTVLSEMNERHAIIENVGGAATIASWEPSKVNRQWMQLVYQGKESFLLRYSNRKVIVDSLNGGRELVGLGNWWLSHQDRTQHRGVIFLPAGPKVVEGCLNLWQGWGVVAKPGKWSKIEAHIRLVGGAHWEYLRNWIAWSFQHPAEQAEVAVVLIGEKGVGKGTLAKILQKVFGPHAFQVTSREEVIGKFNGHLEDCILLVADEAYWGGDKRCVGRLQGMITEPRLPIERKGYDLNEVPNMLHILMLAEPGWVIPAGRYERRYAAFQVTKEQRGNKTYFSSLNAEIDGDGPAAMLCDLSRFDLGDWHPRMIPDGLLQGEALRKQQTLTLPALEQWYLSILNRGILPHALPNRPNTSLTKSLMDDAKELFPRLRYELTDVSLRNFLIDPEKVGIVCTKYRKSSSNGWSFPPLSEARAAWSLIWGPEDWDNPTEEWKRGMEF